MIDIVRTLREQHSDLGPYVVALRRGSGLVLEGDPPRFTPELQAWVEANAPTARLARRTVALAPSPAADAEQRTLDIVALASSAELARFVMRWT
jgi:hypothetical protein